MLTFISSLMKKNILGNLFILIILISIKPISLTAQENQFYSSSNILSMLEKLDVFGKVLYVAAHPDDENTRLIAYLANEKKYETAYLSLTRGGGGQNFIGTHLKENLGLIRTHELLEARKIDGGKQFFSSAIDFGFSKGPDETLKFWNEGKVLSDFVWIIRKFRPDVIITRFNQTPGITHGHHTASTILANKAFNISGDPSVFPEQLKYVKTWKPKRIFWNASLRFQSIDGFDKDKILKMDVGIFNKYLGKSYNEIASESRSMHKSQAFGSLRRRGSETELLLLTQGSSAKKDMMDGINTSWNRVNAHMAIKEYVNNARDSFDVKKPYEIIDNLSLAYKELNKIIDRHWREIKKNEVKKLIKACSGLFFESLSNVEISVPGKEIEIAFEAINRSPHNIKLEKVEIFDEEYIIDKKLEDNIFFQLNKKIKLPISIDVSEKYWLKNKSSFGNYSVKDQLLVGNPENEPAINSKFTFRINGQLITYNSPVVYKINNPTKGDDYKPFNFGNPVYLNPKNNMELFINSEKKDISIEIKSGINNLKTRVFLDVGEEIKVTPSFYDLNFDKVGDVETVSFNISLPNDRNSIKTITAKAEVNNITYHRGIDIISYEHFPSQTRFPKSEISLIKFNLNIKHKKIAYLMGSGDKVPESLRLVGFEVDIFNKDEVTVSNLDSYDALIIGVRAFNTDKTLGNIKSEIMKYMNEGGNVIVQYNTSRNIDVNTFAPFPFKLSRNRVSQENSFVKILDDKHPALNYPNKISINDFDGWVQERGLYFSNNWSKEYQTIISSNDEGEDPNDGGILIAKVGKGHFIYTSYSWFRQLPAGVGGAFRIFTNLISFGKK